MFEKGDYRIITDGSHEFFKRFGIKQGDVFQIIDMPRPTNVDCRFERVINGKINFGMYPETIEKYTEQFNANNETISEYAKRIGGV